MPSIYLNKKLYDALIQQGKDVTTFVNEAVEEKMKEESK